MSSTLAALLFSLRTVCVDLSPLILGQHRAHIFAVAATLTNLLHLAHLVIAQPQAFLHSSHAITAALAAFTLALAVSILMLTFTALPVSGKGRRGQQCHHHDDTNNTFHVRFSINRQSECSEYAYITPQFRRKCGENERLLRFAIIFFLVPLFNSRTLQALVVHRKCIEGGGATFQITLPAAAWAPG